MVSLHELTRALAPSGLNLVGSASVAAYDGRVPAAHALGRRFPGALTALVIGNGGRGFWRAFRGFGAAHPGQEDAAHPLDAFTRRTVQTVAAPLVEAGGRTAHYLYPFRFAEEPVSFMRLAECAGLGTPSVLGVLIHPEYGPWIALRAAILVPDVLEAPRPADGFDPCPGCVERACMSACPAGAVGDAGWDIPRCAGHRLAPAGDGCASRCHARFDCVIGRAHRYPEAALVYHQRWARRGLAAFVRR
jgi:hypothetical protein